MNPRSKPNIASRIAIFRAKLSEAPVSKLTAAAFISGVVGSLTLGVLPDIFALHLKKSTATAYEKGEPGTQKVTKISPGAERVISVNNAVGSIMAFLHLESGNEVYLSSRDAITQKTKRLNAVGNGGRLSEKLPAALVPITRDTPLHIYNASDQKAEVYISLTQSGTP